MIFIFTLIFLMISLSFSTIFERKILSIFNFRQGPMKSFFMGILIPFSDFLKLMNKYFIHRFVVNYLFYQLIVGLILFFLITNFYPLMNSMISFIFFFLLIFIIYSFFIYFIFFMGWSSKSSYSFLSSFRALIQAISYEVGFIFSFLLLMYIWEEYDLFCFYMNSFNFLLNLFFSIIWMIFIFSEMGRSPFDFLEGESELVSGFNTEFMGGLFSMIFMIEYGFMILVSMLLAKLLINSNIMFMVMFFFFCFIRCSFPRLRYDKMMYMFWKDLLISIISLFLLFIFFY